MRLLTPAAAQALTPAGKAVFSVVPILLGGAYLYFAWCLLRGRIAVKTMRGSFTRWVDRRDSPREFWLHWGWSVGGLTLISTVLLGSLAWLSMTLGRG